MTPLLSSALLRTQSDRRLVELVRAGHDAAFAAIVERYRPPLTRSCRRILPDARSEDAVQQALLQAWSALHAGAEVQQLRPWLFAIAHNAAITQLRASVGDGDGELPVSVESGDDPQHAFERRTVVRETLASVAALPDRQREALLAVVMHERPREQVAVELGLTDNALRQLLFRARASLRAAASAVTPVPVLTWMLRGGLGPGAGAGAVAAGSTAGHVAATGTAVLIAGALAVGGPVALDDDSPVHAPAAESRVVAPHTDHVGVATTARALPRAVAIHVAAAPGAATPKATAAPSASSPRTTLRLAPDDVRAVRPRPTEPVSRAPLPMIDPAPAPQPAPAPAQSAPAPAPTATAADAPAPALPAPAAAPADEPVAAPSAPPAPADDTEDDDHAAPADHGDEHDSDGGDSHDGGD